MFNRLLGKGSNKAAASGPPGSHANQGSTAPPVEETTGGGFFNLPPMPAKNVPYGSVAPPAPGVPSGAPVPGPASYSRPTQLPGSYHPQQPPPPHQHQPQMPTYGHSASMSSSYDASAGNGAGGLDMFDGMSIKNLPTAATGASSSVSGAYAHAPAYGGGSATMPLAAAAGAAPPPQPTGGSLFSGLDLAGGGASVSTPHDPHHHHAGAGVMGDRRKSGTRTTGSFNYLDVAANASATTTLTDTHHSRTSSNASGGSAASARSVPKVVKKKKTKSFRPGFGRQLSDESVAALQRGDLKEEDVVHATTTADDSSASARPATNATDLAHLLPPVGAAATGGGGSMLSGLTVHKSAASTSASAGSSVLAGLTLHPAAATSPRTASKRDLASADASHAAGSTATGGVLAGLSVHLNKPSTNKSTRSSDSNEASTSVVTTRESAPSPAAEAPPAAPPTPEQRLQTTLRDFHASAVNFRDLVRKQSDEETRILERKVFLANQLSQYELDLREVEAQQHHACEVEDFERADALNATINSVRHCITLSESDVRKVDAELAACIKAKERAFANQLRSTRGTLRELEKFRDDQERDRASLRDACRAFDVHETQQLQLEAERIDTEMHHVSASLAHLAAEKREIDATIDEQCKDELAARAALQAEKAVVEDEVRELELLLARKLARVNELQGSIDKAEKDIDVVRNRYARQLKRLADREAGIRTTQAEVESDGQQLTAQKRAFHDTLERYASDIAQCSAQLVSVRKQMRAAALLASVLEVQETRREQSLVRKKAQSAELSSLADAAAVAEQSFAMLRNQRDELEKSLAIHRNAIASAESMIPRLEAEKKAAAAQRNFKDAARMSKDIKALEKDRATAEEMVEVVEMELSDLSDRITKRERECDDKRTELRAIETQLELAALAELWKEAAHLRHAMRKMAKRGSTGGDDSVDSDDNVDFRSSALLLVQAELDACVVQIDALEAKYDVRDPNEDAHGDDSDDSDDDDDDDDGDALVLGRDVTGDRDGAAAGAGAGASSGDSVDVGDVDIDALGDSSSALEAIATKLAELDALIDRATENEEYELAERLDEQIDALKRRQHALLALAPRDAAYDASPAAAESDGDAADEEQEDDDDNANQHSDPDQHASAASVEPVAAVAAHDHHDAQTVDELSEELLALRERIIHVEDDIDLATQNEEYESAAAFDDELQELRAEQEAIERLLTAARARESSPSSSTAATSPSQAPSLFLGLGVKQPSVERDIASASATSVAEAPDMFGGLEVAVPAPTLQGSNSSVSHSGVTERSSLGGGSLELSGGGTSSHTLSKPPSPIETAAQSGGAAVVVAAAAPVDTINSPTASRVTGVDSFFGGLQVGGSTNSTVHYPSPASSVGGGASMFGGLQLSSAVATESSSASASSASHDETSSSVFSGLTVSQAATELSAESVETANSEPAAIASGESLELTSQSVHSAEATATTSRSGSMFTGLHVSASSHESHSRTGSASSLIEDNHSTDSPMTIHELSDHTLATDDEESLSGSVVSHGSSFADISFTASAVTTLATETTTTTTTTTTAAAAVSDSSLFGGLSLVQPATVAATATPADGDDAEHAEHAPTEL